MVLIMSRKKVFLLLVSFVFVISLFANFVSAAENNFLNDIFEPFAGIDVAATYDNYWQFIDAFLYFLLFIGVAQFTLSKQFQGTGGKAVVIAMGIALSVALTLWTSKIGFKLGERLGPIAGFILGVIVFIVVVRVVRALSGEEKAIGPAFLIAFGLGFIFVNMFIPEIFTVLKETKFGGIVIGVLNLLFVIAVFYGVPAFIFKHFRGGGGNGGGGGWGPFGRGGTPEERAERRAEEKEEKERKKEERDEKREATADANIMKLSSEMKQIEEKLERIESQEIKQILENLKTYEDHEKILAELNRILVGTWNVDAELGNVMENLKMYPQYYKEKMSEIQEKVERYKKFVSRLIDIVSALKESLEKQKRREQYIKALEKYDKRLLELLKKGDRLEIKDLKKVAKYLARGKKEEKNILKLEEEEGRRIKDLRYDVGLLKDAKLNPLQKLTQKQKIDLNKRIREREEEIKRIEELSAKREELLKKEFQAMKGLVDANKEIRKFIDKGTDILKQIADLDDKDIKTCENTIKFMTGYSSRAIISEILKLGRRVLLSEGDIRQLNERVGDIRKNTKEKIRLLGEYEKLKVEESKVTQFVKNVTDYISKAELYATASDVKALNRLKKTNP